jgi:hypothetical protein
MVGGLRFGFEIPSSARPAVAGKRYLRRGPLRWQLESWPRGNQRKETVGWVGRTQLPREAADAEEGGFALARMQLPALPCISGRGPARSPVRVVVTFLVARPSLRRSGKRSRAKIPGWIGGRRREPGPPLRKRA